jgi:mRNA interferase RelE/StbE
VTYSVTLSRRAKRDLESIDSPHFDMLELKIRSLTDNPRPPGCKKMKGPDAIWRVRAGDYRILYEIDDPKKNVTIVAIGHGREVYR